MRRTKRIKLFRKSLLGLGLAVLSGGFLALARKLRRHRPESSLSASDQDFVKLAAQEELIEVELGHLAGQRGQNEAVRQLGQRLIQDHGRAHGELVSLALAKGFVPPGHLPFGKRIEVETLAQLPAAVFDERFAARLIAEHEKAIARFQQESTRGDDRELREFAQRTLAALHDHLRLAQDLIPAAE